MCKYIKRLFSFILGKSFENILIKSVFVEIYCMFIISIGMSCFTRTGGISKPGKM
jgi:preprotein translocase subunit SecG